MTSPIVVSFGMGTNSTAVLVGLFEQSTRPDLIMAADTGNEWPRTYAHVEFMQAWLQAIGFPPITMVRNELPQGLKDGTLYDEVYRLGTMPSKVFGRSACSMKWKVEPQNKYLKKWMQKRDVAHVRQMIGYDAGETRRLAKQFPTVKHKTIEYPLAQWGWYREDCIAAIDRVGIPRPGKSACFMCPSSRKPEVIQLRQEHPDLYRKAIALEARALAGEGQAPAAQMKGLGRHWNWATFAGSDTATPEPCMTCHDGDADD